MSPARCGPEAAEPTPGYLTVQQAFLQEDFPQVTMLAQNFLAQTPEAPEMPRVWLWLALSLDKLERANEALRELDRLKARLAPDDPLWAELLFWEGDISRRAIQMVRARLAYQRLIERHPTTTWAAQAQLGMGLAAAGDVNGDGYSDILVSAPNSCLKPLASFR